MQGKFYITGAKRGLGQALKEKYGSAETLQDCDIFINCKHDGFKQVELLFEAAKLGKRIINIGSNSADGIKNKPWIYSVEKSALDKANEQLFYQNVNTSIFIFSMRRPPRVAKVDAKKMSIEYCVSIIDWMLEQPHRIKEITICP